MQKCKKNIITIVAVICTAVLCLLSAVMVPMSYSAAETGSLTLICRTEGVTLEGLEWDIYRVGSRSGDEFILEGEFADYPVVIDDFTAEAMNLTAKTLENYAVLDKLTPMASGETNENGTLTFDALQEGLYLVSGQILTIGNTTYVPSTILFEIGEEGASYDLNAYPKIIYRTNSAMVTNYAVKKIWEFSINNEVELPEEITIEVYCDRELYDTVVLSEENNWTHSWMGEEDCEWRVKEINLPEGCTVKYDFGETQYAIVNTIGDNYVEPPTTPTTTTTTTTTTTGTGSTDITTTTTITDTTTESQSTASTTGGATTTAAATTTTTVPGLPQTGQLWWPVPVLGVSGLVLIAFGLRMNSERKKDNSDEIN